MTRTHERHANFVEDQREFFDELVTEDYDSYFDPAWNATRELELDRLFELIDARRVIDVGCGIGFHDAVMVERHGVEEVLGIDYSAKSIEVAERTYPNPAVERRVGDIFELPPADFDLAVSFQVVEHVTNPVDFTRACAEQVRPGGAVALYTPNYARLENRFLRRIGREPVLSDPQHFQEFTPRTLEALGRDAGLEPVGAFGYGLSFLIPKLGWQAIPHRLGLRLGGAAPTLASGICAVFTKPG